MNSTTIVVQLWRILCLCWVVLTGSLKKNFVSCGNNFLISCLFHCDTNNRTTLISLSAKTTFSLVINLEPGSSCLMGQLVCMQTLILIWTQLSACMTSIHLNCLQWDEKSTCDEKSIWLLKLINLSNIQTLLHFFHNHSMKFAACFIVWLQQQN